MWDATCSDTFTSLLDNASSALLNQQHLQTMTHSAGSTCHWHLATILVPPLLHWTKRLVVALSNGRTIYAPPLSFSKELVLPSSEATVLVSGKRGELSSTGLRTVIQGNCFMSHEKTDKKSKIHSFALVKIFYDVSTVYVTS